MLFGDDSTASSVEEVLEKGLYQSGASPVHIVIEGAAETGSVRCHWRGMAMTLSQREKPSGHVCRWTRMSPCLHLMG